MPRGYSRRFLQAARGACRNDSIPAWQDLRSPHSWARAGPEFSSTAGQAGRALSCNNIHPPAQHPSPDTASIPSQNIHPLAKHLSLFCVPTATALAGARPPCCAVLCHAGPLHPCSPPQHPLAPCQGAAGGLIIFIPGAAAGVPHCKILEMSPTEPGTTGEPRVTEGGLGTGHAGSAVSLPCVPIPLCPSSPVPLPRSAVPRMSCDLSQFQCAPVQTFPLEPCPG